MPEFQINWLISGVLMDKSHKRKSTSLKLNEDWSIRCVLMKNIYQSYRYIAIELKRRKNNTAEEVLVTGSLSFLKNDKTVWTENFSLFMNSGIKWLKLVPNVDMELNATRDRFVGHVKISSETRDSKEKIQHKSLEELSKDLEKLLNPESAPFADVILKCGGVSISAYKNFLSARSPVFAAMFANPMKESLTNEVDIDDLNESVLRELLMYTYTGKTSELTAESAADLLFAAEKYQLQDLKIVCSYFLKNTMSLQDVWKLLIQGDLLSTDLKSFALHYICDNYDKFADIEKTQEWKDLKIGRPDVALELTESVLKYRDGKPKRMKIGE